MTLEYSLRCILYDSNTSLHRLIGHSSYFVITKYDEYPINLYNEVSSELHRMTLEGINCPVKKPTARVSSITYVRKKSGDIRIYLDHKDLNNAIFRPHYTSRNRTTPITYFVALRFFIN